MYPNVEFIKHCFLRVKLGGFIIFFSLFFCGGTLVADSSSSLVDISQFSHSEFSVLKDIANGLNGFFGIINRRLEDNAHNINNKAQKLTILSMEFKQFQSSGGLLKQSEEDDSDIEPKVTSIPLVYPNPFRQSTDGGAILSYDLSKDFTFEIHIYNMLSQRVFKQTFQEGFYGARKGSNRLRINRESLGGYLVSSGVYFYVFVHNQEVLAKGKMVVKP